MLFDFTNGTVAFDDWMEVSDTEREVGKSKGVLVPQTTQQFQRAIFFTLLNPQPNGAGFAGIVYRKKPFDLTAFQGLKLTVRAQGENFFYKAMLRHHNDESSLQPSYEAFFEVRREPRSIVCVVDSFELCLATEKRAEGTISRLRGFQAVQPW